MKSLHWRGREESIHLVRTEALILARDELIKIHERRMGFRGDFGSPGDMRRVVPPEMTVARLCLARRQRTDNRDRPLFASFSDELSQVPTEGVNGFRSPGPLNAFGFFADPSERAVAGGSAIIVRSELHQDEIALFDLGPQVLPKESAVKTAAAGASESAIDDVDFVLVEICDDRRAPTPLVHVGAITQRAVSHRRVTDDPQRGQCGVGRRRWKISSIARSAVRRGRTAHLSVARHIADLN